MENEFDVTEDISNTSSDSVAETEEFIELDNSDDEVDYKALYEAEKAEKAKIAEVARNQKIRAEKAEKTKEAPKTETNTPKESLKPADLLAVIESKVSSDDLDDVIEFAQFKNISVKEALKSSTVQAILKDKQEVRASAYATNTGTAKRSSSKLSDQALLDKVAKGEFPEDDETIKRLISLTVK